MLTALDESLHHQGPLTFEHVLTTDHRFYDRQLMGAFQPDGDAGFVAGITVFKNMNVVEGYVIAQSRSRKQYNVRLSKQLRPMPVNTDAVIGPLALQVVDPFKELRFVLERGDYPVALDITFYNVLPPRLENPHFGRLDGRVHSDYLRYHQIGKVSGWIEIDGERFDAKDWFGWRDHSWGVRPGVGGFEPMAGTQTGGGVAAASRTGGKGMFLMHQGFSNGCEGGSLQVIEDSDGKRVYTDGEVHLAGGEEVAIAEVSHDIVFQPGTRVFETAAVELALANGATWKLKAHAVGRPLVYRGGGFDGGFNDAKGQGVWRSAALLTEVDSYDVSDPELVVFPDGSTGRPKHREQWSRCEINGVAGSAYVPMFVIGNHPRWGLTA